MSQRPLGLLPKPSSRPVSPTPARAQHPQMRRAILASASPSPGWPSLINSLQHRPFLSTPLVQVMTLTPPNWPPTPSSPQTRPPRGSRKVFGKCKSAPMTASQSSREKVRSSFVELHGAVKPTSLPSPVSQAPLPAHLCTPATPAPSSSSKNQVTSPLRALPAVALCLDCHQHPLPPSSLSDLQPFLMPSVPTWPSLTSPGKPSLTPSRSGPLSFTPLVSWAFLPWHRLRCSQYHVLRVEPSTPTPTNTEARKSGSWLSQVPGHGHGYKTL